MVSRTFQLKTNKQRSYIRLTDVLDFFEADIFGGKTRATKAPRLASVQYGAQSPIEDDIPEGHNFFRGREAGVVTKFLDDHDLHPGDLIRLDRVAPYTYRFMPG
ncbi:MAG: hypothetical protein JWP42_2391 [Pseudomonas sp.]|nr:hypothetical protein [Pseudomonas sp.]